MPTVRSVIPLRVADPAVTVTGLPRSAPSMPNCTCPVIDPAYVEVTVAVKVTPWPDTEGLGEEVTPVEVLALTTTCPPSSSAAARASAGEVARRPSETGISKRRKSSFPWYS